MNQRLSTQVLTVAGLLIAVSSLGLSPADARRGGSFGSRGSRTYFAPRATYASGNVAPIQRSMTARPAAQASPAYTPAFGQSQAYRPARSRFGGFGGGLVGGLLAGGLIGHFLGGGVGGGWGSSGGGGMLASLLQIAILGGIIWLVIGIFRRRSGGQPGSMREGFDAPTGFAPQAASGPWGGGGFSPRAEPDQGEDIALTSRDQQDFERLLVDVQDAFGREDYARLRLLTTPEIMSYLSEELIPTALSIDRCP